MSIAASGDPAQIELIAQVLVPGAESRWAAAAVAAADIVVLAIPLHRFAALDPSLVSGKLVVDVMNYWPAVDGVVPMFGDRRGQQQRNRPAAAGVLDGRQGLQPHRLPRTGRGAAARRIAGAARTGRRRG